MAFNLDAFTTEFKGSKPATDYLTNELEANSAAYKELTRHFEPIAPLANIDPAYQATRPNLKLKSGSAVETVVSQAEALAQVEEASKKSLGAAYKQTAAAADSLFKAAGEGHTKLDGLAEHVGKVGDDLQKHYNDAILHVGEAETAGKLTSAEAKAAREALKMEFEQANTLRSGAGKLIEESRGKLQTATGIAPKAGAVSGVKAAGEMAKNTAGKLAPIGKEAYEKLNKFGKIKADRRFAWDHSGTGGKWARGIGTGVGVVIIGSGLGNLASSVGLSSPKLDENGQEIEISRAGELFKGLAKVGAGAAAAYFSLTKGGKALATGV